MKTPALYFFRTVCAVVLLPLIFILVYPWVYMILPETTARLADLPQDLMIFLLIDVIFVPIAGVWLYFRARYMASEKGVRETGDTRDVL